MLVLSSCPLQAQMAEPPAAAYHGIPLPSRSLTDAQPRLPASKSRWDRFEAEFGLRDNRNAGVLASIARAKYGLDLATFSLNTFLNAIEDATELRYCRGRVSRVSASPTPVTPHRGAGPVTLEDARLKLDLAMTGSRPYVGVRIVIPFGD